MLQEDCWCVVPKVDIPKGRPAEVCDQIIFPKSLRAEVLKLACELPKTGHLAREQMLERIWKVFF